MVWPGAIEWYLSWGETIAAWKSIECIIGAAVTLTPGTGSSLRLVMLNRMRSPTRARTVGPGTWSPKVHALNFTPGAISMILCVVSSRISFTGDGSSGASFAVLLSAAPSANGPVWRSCVVFEGGESSTSCDCANATLAYASARARARVIRDVHGRMAVLSGRSWTQFGTRASLVVCVRSTKVHLEYIFGFA